MNVSHYLNVELITLEQEVPHYLKFDLNSICMPVKADVFSDLLIKTNYDSKEREFLINGFTNGFPLMYKGPMD